jgi:tRNA (guanine26-N2/guanine27-N2)-dimethyltransferase
MGLRILLSALARAAARRDVGVEPVLSHVSDHYVRTYLALEHSASAANAAIDSLGHVHQCQDCLHRTTASGLLADPPDRCPTCAGTRVVTAGPVWLDRPHDPAFVERVRTALPEWCGTADAADRLLARIGDELDTPTHYDQHRLCKEWGRAAPGMDEFLEALRAAGHAATRSHYGGTTFKTAATVREIRAATGD